MKPGHKALVINGAKGLQDRQKEDYYATDPRAVEMLLELEEFDEEIWEPASGGGHISKVLKEQGYKVWSTDKYDQGYYDDLIDFFEYQGKWEGDIITNPPYKMAQRFVEKALEVIPKGNKVAMFLKLTFLETASRRELFEVHPPKYIYISSKRLSCAKDGDFSNTTNAIAYCWYIWEKGYTEEPKVRWFN